MCKAVTGLVKRPKAVTIAKGASMKYGLKGNGYLRNQELCQFCTQGI